METENITCTVQERDITELLSSMIEAGWTEHQIVRFARMRATYANATVESKKLDTANIEQNRLAFVSWLYSQGRLVS